MNEQVIEVRITVTGELHKLNNNSYFLIKSNFNCDTSYFERVSKIPPSNISSRAKSASNTPLFTWRQARTTIIKVEIV